MSKNKYLLIVLLLFCSNLLQAQALVPAWASGADQRDQSFGFYFTYVSSNYNITKTPNWRSPYFDPASNKLITDSLNAISSRPLPGFAIGLISRYRITENIEARITPSLVFADRSISYSYNTPSQNVDKLIQTTSLDLPLTVKLKSDRIANFRAYVIGGVKYSLAIGSKNQSTVDTNPLDKMVRNIGGFGTYEAGFGCDIYFEFFKLSPEIKFSNSFGNVLVQDGSPFSSPISRLSLHNIMFSLLFE
jgi:hypothetical protein